MDLLQAHSSRRTPSTLQSILSRVPSVRASRLTLTPPNRLHAPDLPDFNAIVAFAGQWITDYRLTASVIPSSAQLARAMVLPSQIRGARTVVEFGPGTGPMTDLILKGLPAGGNLYSFEINPVFVEYLAAHFPDPRLQVISADAATVSSMLRERGHDHADAVISSLPLSFLGSDSRDRILAGAAESLAPGGVFTQFQYASGLDCSGRFPRFYDLRPVLKRHFRRVHRHIVWLNLPPAFVYVCTNGRAGAA